MRKAGIKLLMKQYYSFLAKYFYSWFLWKLIHMLRQKFYKLFFFCHPVLHNLQIWIPCFFFLNIYDKLLLFKTLTILTDCCHHVLIYLFLSPFLPCSFESFGELFRLYILFTSYLFTIRIFLLLFKLALYLELFLRNTTTGRLIRFFFLSLSFFAREMIFSRSVFR